MATETTYANLRENLAAVLQQVDEDREIVIVRRKGAGDIALISAEELRSLTETAHLLRSPKNAERLLTALRRANGRKVKPEPVAKLRSEMGIESTNR